MKLTRKQEEMLIRIGLNTLLNGKIKDDEPVPVPRRKKYARRGRRHPGVASWSPEHREKFYATLNRKKQESEDKKPPTVE